MSDVAHIDKAIGAHGMWKSRLRRAIDSGSSEFSVDQVSKDNQCEFGKWLYSLPASEMNSENVRHIRTLHAKFHAHAAESLGLALRGSKAEAEKSISLGSSFANTSAELTKALMDWKKSAV